MESSTQESGEGSGPDESIRQSMESEMIRVPKGGEGEVVALEDRSSELLLIKKLFNANNLNSNNEILLHFDYRFQ
jgi:hypothetical protein